MVTPKTLEEKFSLQRKVELETEELKKRQADLFKLTERNVAKLEKVQAELNNLEGQAKEQTEQIDAAMKVLRAHQARVQKREELKNKILELIYEDYNRR